MGSRGDSRHGSRWRFKHACWSKANSGWSTLISVLFLRGGDNLWGSCKWCNTLPRRQTHSWRKLWRVERHSFGRKRMRCVKWSFCQIVVASWKYYAGGTFQPLLYLRKMVDDGKTWLVNFYSALISHVPRKSNCIAHTLARRPGSLTRWLSNELLMFSFKKKMKNIWEMLVGKNI